MSKALGINPDIGLRELLRVSQSNEFDVVYNPLKRGPGGQQGGTFIKPSAAHAGASTSFSENGGDPDDLPQGASVQPLESYKNEFEDAKGSGEITGLAILNHNESGMMIVPRRAAMYAQFANNGTIEAGEENGLELEEAQQMYVSATGRQLAGPSVS